MLYADFYFRMKRQDAVCIAGWTMGAITGATLDIGGQMSHATSVLTHRRGDLPNGAIGFILRFELNGEILDAESTLLRMSGPDRACAFPPASANMDALISQATDEAFSGFLLGLADGIFAVEDYTAMGKVHNRVVGMAGTRSFSELPDAAVAQDQALSFANPPRVLVNGWLGDDGKAGNKLFAMLIDSNGDHPLSIFRDSLIRPDLAGAQIRGLRVGISSGYVGGARIPRELGHQPVCMVGMIHDGFTVCTLRMIHPMTAVDMGPQFDHLRRNLVDADQADAIFANLLPSLPDYLNGAAEPVERHGTPTGVAYVVEHDLDHWLGRDVIRLVRRAEPALAQIGILTETASEGLIRSTLADRTEAGAGAPRVDLVTTNAPLARWAPNATHLVVSTTATLFQTLPFAQLAEAREQGQPATCLVMVDTLEAGATPLTEAEGIAALLDGQPFVGQIDQTQCEPSVYPESMHVSQTAQMRWLLITLARSGLVSFTGLPGLAFLPGRDPLPAQNRQIELRAMRLAAMETAN